MTTIDRSSDLQRRFKQSLTDLIFVHRLGYAGRGAGRYDDPREIRDRRRSIIRGDALTAARQDVA